MQSICLVYLLHSHQHYENEKNSLKILHFMKSLVLLPTFLFLQVCILWHKLCANKPPKQVTALVHGAATLVLYLFLRYYYRGEQITSHLSHLEETVGSTCPWNAVVLVHYQINAVPFALYRYCNRHKLTSFFNEILTKRLLGKKKNDTCHATNYVGLVLTNQLRQRCCRSYPSSFITANLRAINSQFIHIFGGIKLLEAQK